MFNKKDKEQPIPSAESAKERLIWAVAHDRTVDDGITRIYWCTGNPFGKHTFSEPLTCLPEDIIYITHHEHLHGNTVMEMVVNKKRQYKPGTPSPGYLGRTWSYPTE
jgi:hypothetical protein